VKGGCFITCGSWGCKSPFLVMIVKNTKKCFSFEVQVRMSKNQSDTKTMPLKLEDGWNQIQFNLSDLTKTAFGTNYTETLRVQIHVNRRIRRVFFTERLYSHCPSRGPESSVHLLDRFWVPSELRCSLCVLQK
uniref:CFA20 domain-containing protein n=1 Tax=Oryzias latipes TaxID=8090 RepID=A0A3P9LVA3_ORYLA